MSVDRMWGQETIPGTRIPIFRIAQLVNEGGYSPQVIAKDIYPQLSEEQVISALKLIVRRRL